MIIKRYRGGKGRKEGRRGGGGGGPCTSEHSSMIIKRYRGGKGRKEGAGVGVGGGGSLYLGTFVNDNKEQVETRHDGPCHGHVGT